MAVWPFNRKKQDEALPEEVKEFYESDRKERSGKAWLLALGTLVVTVLLAAVLFYGGRWVYDQIAGDDEPQTPTTEQTGSQISSDGSQPESPDSDNADDSQQGSSGTSTNQPSPASTPDSQTSTPTTGPSDAEIPDTGPGPNGLQ